MLLGWSTSESGCLFDLALAPVFGFVEIPTLICVSKVAPPLVVSNPVVASS